MIQKDSGSLHSAFFIYGLFIDTENIPDYIASNGNLD
jgi:hypothetical protein